MKKFICLAAATVALVASQAANAQTFLSPGGPYTYSGAVDVTKDSITLNCTLSADITNSAGALSVDNITLTGGFLGLCASVTFLSQPYSATFSAPNLTLHNVHARAATNGTECFGDLVLVQTGTGSDTFTVNAILPKLSGANDCRIDNGSISYP
jgi:hypothetical protein